MLRARRGARRLLHHHLWGLAFICKKHERGVRILDTSEVLGSKR